MQSTACNAIPNKTGSKEHTRVPIRNCLIDFKLECLQAESPKKVTGTDNSHNHSHIRGLGTNSSSTSSTNISNLSNTSGASLVSIKNRRMKWIKIDHFRRSLF